MAINNQDMAQPDNRVISNPTRQDLAGMADKWKPRERSSRDMAGLAVGQRRRMGGVRRAVAVGLAAGSLLVGGNMILNGDHNKQSATGGSETPVPTLTPAELKIDNLKVSEFNPERSPTDILNGIVTIRINTENDTPPLSTTPGLIDDHNPENMKTFSEINEINGVPIAEAVDSNGKKELVFTDPLITKIRGVPYVTFLSGGKPVYLGMRQENISSVLVQVTGKDMYSPIPANANVLDYGKVSFQDSP